MRNSGLCHVEVAVEVRLQRFVEVLVGQVLDVTSVNLEGGVVDEDVEATKLHHRFFHCLSAEARILDVAFDHKALASLLLDSSLCVICVLRFIEMHDGDVRPFTGKEDCHRPTDAGVTPP